MSQIATTITPLELGQKQVQLVKFVGQLDETNVDSEVTKIYEIFENTQGTPYLLFDLSELTFLNSKSIGYLTDWYGKATEKNGEIIIAQARENVMDVLQVVGLTNIIKTFLTVEEAKLELLER